ncbi:MAG: hypothetical protein M5U19_09050 [Microthrixaceae bacterium]|nr:hypothetical protein [Microthrixaceae bacterium]
MSSYTYPWYLFLGLPTLALSGDLVLLAIVSTRATLMAAGYQYGRSDPATSLIGRLSMAITVVLVVAFVWRIACRSGRRPGGVSGRDGQGRRRTPAPRSTSAGQLI